MSCLGDIPYKSFLQVSFDIAILGKNLKLMTIRSRVQKSPLQWANNFQTWLLPHGTKHAQTLLLNFKYPVVFNAPVIGRHKTLKYLLPYLLFFYVLKLLSNGLFSFSSWLGIMIVPDFVEQLITLVSSTTMAIVDKSNNSDFLSLSIS